MIKKQSQSGFTMVELLITMVIFVLTIAAASMIFVPLLTQFKQQSRIAETQIEEIIGLEILRRDLEMAGFGLPWEIPASVNYNEGSGSTTAPIPAPSTYNDCSGTAPCNPPRAILSDNDVAGLGGSDYLVIKSTAVATSAAATKWTYVVGTGGGGRTVRFWDESAEDLDDDERVIVIIPSRGEDRQRILVNSGTVFSVQFDLDTFPADYSPATEGDLYLIYGVAPKADPVTTPLRLPFNRADYYIRRTADTTIPQRCATGTGVLMKSVINQSNGNRGLGMPLLDCVADMQVIFQRDTDGDGDIDDTTDDIFTLGLTAQQIREQVKEVRVYILAHEGQRDVNYTYRNDPTNPVVTVGEFGLGRDFNLVDAGITNWENYRWKVYTIVVKPKSLG